MRLRLLAGIILVVPFPLVDEERRGFQKVQAQRAHHTNKTTDCMRHYGKSNLHSPASICSFDSRVGLSSESLDSPCPHFFFPLCSMKDVGDFIFHLWRGGAWARLLPEPYFLGRLHGRSSAMICQRTYLDRGIKSKIRAL